jgi:hopanoid biosynthesis associated protein HpnK
MKRLIVNADDFGLTERVNEGIIEGHIHGIITSTTLLANGSAFESAVEKALRHLKLGVGVHLNLTEGSPVSDPSNLPSLVNQRGDFFCGSVSLAERIMAGRVDLTEVEKELRSQIEKVRTAGIAVTHVDGHKHFHVLPPVIDIVIRLAREYGIKSVRCTVERSVELFRLMGRNGTSSVAVLRQFLTGRALSVVSSGLRKKLQRARLNCPSHFYGITQTGFLDVEALKTILSNLPEGTGEIMCHPGYCDGELTRTPTRLRVQREKELRALIHPEIKALIAELGIQLISYRNLIEDR